MEGLERGQTSRERAIAIWLLAVCAMIYVMVVLGGVTRLTYSGLSMVDWKPLTGWLPPLTPEAWDKAFADYQQYPEFKDLNASMTLAEFKGIFLMEFAHRLWGRLIGVVFLVPLIVFFVRGWVDSRLLSKLIVMFVLGGAQGGIGWHMVKSGLVDQPDVSAYRLVIHLGFALLIYAYILWTALGLLCPRGGGETASAGLRRYSGFVPAVVFLTILSGGFVAGINAGFAYNTFPTMDGEWIPSALFAIRPIYFSFFEDVTTVQFDHRVLALTVVVLILVLWAISWRAPLGRRGRLAANLLALMALVQPTLGAFTVVFMVPPALGALHQAGAVMLFTLALWTAHETRCPIDDA